MAGDVRIYYQIDDKEYSIEQWLNTDTLDTSDPEVLEAVMSVVPPGRAPSILRVIDIGSDGKSRLESLYPIYELCPGC